MLALCHWSYTRKEPTMNAPMNAPILVPLDGSVLGIEAVLHHGLVEVVGAGQVLEVEAGGRDDVEPGEPLALDDAMEGHAAVANDSRAR